MNEAIFLVTDLNEVDRVPTMELFREREDAEAFCQSMGNNDNWNIEEKDLY